MKKFRKIIVMLLVVMTMMALTTMTTHAISLDYSGGSSSNDTGAGATTSGFSVSYSETNSNICGYRFSIVTSSGTPKSGTKVVNVYLSDVYEGTQGYSSAQRFVTSSGTVANKKQLANGTKVSSTTTKQSCEYKSGDCGFYSTLPQNPNSVGSWIKNSANSYQNLSRIYVLCGTSLASASESDYVLIEPMFRPSLAGKRVAATATELALYGAAVSGGDQYSGTNGNLYNAGSGTLWNLCNYVNREFPNALYVSENTAVYNAVTIKTSSRYTYKQIIQNGYGCSVLTVKNVIPVKKVHIAYNPNGGTTNTALNEWGWVMLDGTVYFHTINHGNSDDPYNASTFGLTRTGYQFGGWKVNSTGAILDQNTSYASTVYAQYDDASKTTANTSTVYCYLYAVWIPNTVKIAYHPNGGTASNATLNDYGFLKYNGETYFQTINHGSKADPYNASTLGLTRTGYTFKGWKVKSTGTVLDQNTEYASTVYAQHDDKNKTTANTTTVYCYLYAEWEKNTYTNTIAHWKYVGTGGDNSNGTYKYMGSSTFSGTYGSSVTIPSNLIQSYTGHYNTGIAGSYWGTSTWSSKNIGSTFTQPAQAISMEYYYYPKTVNVIFNKNDGSGDTANQSFTYAQSGNRFGYNRDGTPKWNNNSGQFGGWDRTGYTLLGWSESPSATSATYSIYSNVSDSWINSKVPDPNATGTVNLYAVWKLYAKIVIVPIDPNASYRENTDVISSYWLVNISGDDYTPSTGAKVVFSVYNASGQKIAGETQDFVSPNNDKNLAYFKWRVPNGYGGQNVTIKAHIVDGSYQYSHIERSYRIASFDTCTTPNTSYKDKAPSGFTVPSAPYDNATSARWWQWTYSNGAYVKKNYAITNTISNVTLTTPTNPSAYTSNGYLYMKSGYGFECSYTHSMSNVSGYDSTSSSKSVAPQYFYALFPEYNYVYGINQCRSFTTVSGKKVFVSASDMARQHFTPIYYPDGDYKFQIVLSDCWTPAGMLTTYKTVTIKIDGNMYDDWYVGRK